MLFVSLAESCLRAPTDLFRGWMDWMDDRFSILQHPHRTHRDYYSKEKKRPATEVVQAKHPRLTRRVSVSLGS